MNYYPFHIGDYIKDTAHLSWDEDMAYRRLMDLTYSTEKVLPLDPVKLCRLARATTEEQKAAVLVVVEEFFTKTPDGWTHAHCMAEIEKMREQQDANEERDEHEKTRMQRFRERRSVMFAHLRTLGIVPAWDLKMADLQRLYDSNGGPPVTQLVTPPVTPEDLSSANEVTAVVTPPVTGLVTPVIACNGNATAIPTPTPTPTPTPRKKEEEAPLPLAFSLPNWIPEESWAGYAEMRRRQRKPMTDRARDLKISELKRFHEKGYDVGAILDKSTANCWTDVYEPKGRDEAGQPQASFV